MFIDVGVGAAETASAPAPEAAVLTSPAAAAVWPPLSPPRATHPPLIAARHRRWVRSRRTPALWQWAFDWILAHLDLDVSLVHIRVEDRRNHFAWGIKMNKV